MFWRSLKKMINDVESNLCDLHASTQVIKIRLDRVEQTKEKVDALSKRLDALEKKEKTPDYKLMNFQTAVGYLRAGCAIKRRGSSAVFRLECPSETKSPWGVTAFHHFTDADIRAIDWEVL